MTTNATARLTLEERLTRLEDAQAIQRVMSTYGESVDNGYDLAALERLLTQDLVWTSNAFGEYHGRKEYLEGQAQIGKGVAWAFHVMVPLRIDVLDEVRARGTFYLLMLGTFIRGDTAAREPMVISARYDNEFAKQDDVWRCSRMNVHFNQVSRLTEGWVREQYWAG